MVLVGDEKREDVVRRVMKMGCLVMSENAVEAEAVMETVVAGSGGAVELLVVVVVVVVRRIRGNPDLIINIERSGAGSRSSTLGRRR